MKNKIVQTKASNKTIVTVMLILFAAGLLVLAFAVLERNRVVALVGAFITAVSVIGIVIQTWMQASEIQ